MEGTLRKLFVNGVAFWLLKVKNKVFLMNIKRLIKAIRSIQKFLQVKSSS